MPVKLLLLLLLLLLMKMAHGQVEKSSLLVRHIRPRALVIEVPPEDDLLPCSRNRINQSCKMLQWFKMYRQSGQNVSLLLE